MDLTGANLRRTDLTDADLTDADLTDAELRGAVLRRAHLSGARLRRTDLTSADLFSADLRLADLTGADLMGADFFDAHVSGADMQLVIVAWTKFVNVDLSEVKGLDTVRHGGPSSIGIDTIYRSQGNIPEVFLRGAGVPDDFITYMRSLVGLPIEYHSCFISYSSKDQKFADRLYADLQIHGVRCWFAPEDLKIGERMRVGIDEAIHVRDKLLLILSEHSVSSDWVEKEVETAMEQERRQKRTVLFPIRLDDAVMKVENGWPADIRRTRHIGDFQRWKQHDDYLKGLNRLLRDLKADSAATKTSS